MKIEDFPINDKALDQFIKENKKKWATEENSRSTCYSLINLSMVRMQIPWVLPKLLFAKGLQKKTGAMPVALTWNENEKLTSFFNSFGIEHIALNSLCRRNIIGAIKALFKTVAFLFSGASGEKLKCMQILGICVGLNLYEDILRTSSLSTLKSCRNKVALKKILHLIWSMYTLDRYIKKHPLKYAVTDDMAYHEGCFIKLFMKYDAKVLACSNVAEIEVKLNDKGEVIRHNWHSPEEISEYVDKLSDDAIEQVDQYLEERFQGKNGRDIDRQAFLGKKVLSRNELLDMYHIKNSKKNIVIMAHTFTDAVFNYGNYYFRDYYDWMDKTLALASTIDTVNWILKPHPSRASYNESVDSIEAMFERYKKDNMFMLSDDISSESIKNIADCIITIGGNAGAEYACFGIPSIIVGKPFYSMQGYTTEPETYAEYENVLRDIQNVHPLTEEQVIKAKKVFFFSTNKKPSKNKFSDDFSILINNQYKKMTDEISHNYFNNNDGTEKYNTEAIQLVMDYTKTHDLRETEYYKRANTV